MQVSVCTAGHCVACTPMRCVASQLNNLITTRHPRRKFSTCFTTHRIDVQHTSQPRLDNVLRHLNFATPCVPMCHARMCSTWTCPGRHARHCAHIVRQFCALRLSVERAWSARTQSETHTSHTVQTLRATLSHITSVTRRVCVRLTGARRRWLAQAAMLGGCRVIAGRGLEHTKTKFAEKEMMAEKAKSAEHEVEKVKMVAKTVW